MNSHNNHAIPTRSIHGYIIAHYAKSYWLHEDLSGPRACRLLLMKFAQIVGLT